MVDELAGQKTSHTISITPVQGVEVHRSNPAILFAFVH